MKIALWSTVLTVAVIAPAVAQPLYDEYGPVTLQSVDVYTGDLNLADPRDRDEAVRRIDQATQAACRPLPDLRALEEVADYRGCRVDAFENGVADLEHRAAHGDRRGHVTTREYPAPPEPQQ